VPRTTRQVRISAPSPNGRLGDTEKAFGYTRRRGMIIALGCKEKVVVWLLEMPALQHLYGSLFKI